MRLLVSLSAASVFLAACEGGGSKYEMPARSPEQNVVMSSGEYAYGRAPAAEHHDDDHDDHDHDDHDHDDHHDDGDHDHDEHDHEHDEEPIQLSAAADRVLILQTTELSRPAEVIGVVDAHEKMGHHGNALAHLKARAAAMGADAVVGVEFHHGEGQGEPTHLSGLAVRFLSSPP
jgi:hypothetical protein